MKSAHSGFATMLAALCLSGTAGVADTVRIGPHEDPNAIISRLAPGDTAILTRGQHHHSIQISGLRGTPEAPITIQGESGTRIRPTNGRDGIVFWGGGGSAHVIVEHLLIEGGRRGGIVIAGSRHMLIRHCTIIGSGVWGIQTVLSDHITIEHCDISGSGRQHGIYFSTTDHPTVRNCKIYNNAGCGIHMNGDPGEGGDGVISGGLVEKNDIFGNGRRGGAGINMDGVDTTTIRNNRIFGNYAGGITAFTIDGKRSGPGLVVEQNIVTFPAGAGRYGLQFLTTRGVTVASNTLDCATAPSIEVNAAALETLTSDGNTFCLSAQQKAFAIGDERLTAQTWTKRTGCDARSRITIRQPSK